MERLTDLMRGLEELLAETPAVTVAEVCNKLDWVYAGAEQGLWKDTHTAVLASALQDLRREPSLATLRLDEPALAARGDHGPNTSAQ